MQLKSLWLQHIRSHTSFITHFDHPVTVIIGPNASGKTTIVEAVHLLATGQSFRATKIEEMVSIGAEIGRVKGVVEEVLTSKENAQKESEATKENNLDEVEVMVTHGLVQGKKTSKRLYLVNAVRRRKQDAVGKFFTVVFRPEDMRLIEGSPARRRSFLNDVLSPLYKEYAQSLKIYEQTLIRRNKLLSQIQEGKQSASSLQYWNLTLLKHGEILQTYRRNFLGTYNQVVFPQAFSVKYLPSVISEERMKEYSYKEMAAGYTLIGPHKDDFDVEVTKTLGNQVLPWSLPIYGSRGEQRLGVLWLKFGQLQFILDITKQKPIWLLDDILSELDRKVQEKVLTAVKNYQTIITTTDEHLLPLIRQHLENIKVMQFPENHNES